MDREDMKSALYPIIGVIVGILLGFAMTI